MGAAEEVVSREFFSMEGDLAWVIQVSDLHLSAYHPNRAEDLAELLGSAIRIIRPDLVLVTGEATCMRFSETVGKSHKFDRHCRRRMSAAPNS